MKVTIEDSQFSANEGFSDGGAVRLFCRDDLIVTIDNCAFTGNKAGVNPFTRSRLNHYSYTISEALSLVFQDYIQEKPDRFSFILLSERTTRTVFTYEILGDGGALHISGARVNIRDTVFVNNTASGDGGSILITKEATVTVFNVHMVTTGSHKVGSSHGEAIYSQEPLHTQNEER